MDENQKKHLTIFLLPSKENIGKNYAHTVWIKSINYKATQSIQYC